MRKNIKKYDYIAGIDEVGRGPIAGPVCVGLCAVKSSRMTDFKRFFRGARDSKQLSETRREEWFNKIQKAEKKGMIETNVSFSNPKTIDSKGIAVCIKKAVYSLLNTSNTLNEKCLVLLDGGLKAPPRFVYQETIMKGDEKEIIIMIASILAKVTRDRRMNRYAKKFSGYGFENHKGYGTRAHYKALQRLGPSVIHRKSFLSGFLSE